MSERMIKKEDFVQYKDELYKVSSTTEYGICWIKNDIGFKRMIKTSDLVLWEPSTSMEIWMSWNFEKRWFHYKRWKIAAERRGITVEKLLTDVYPGIIVLIERL